LTAYLKAKAAGYLSISVWIVYLEDAFDDVNLHSA